MKILQNNFTTPEQSKRLLELGVPADSADCYHNVIAGKPFLITYGTLFSDPRHQFSNGTLPCWSVGRLIEILLLLGVDKDPDEVSISWKAYEIGIVEAIVRSMEKYKHNLDFSKLEE